MPSRILIVEDECSIQSVLRELLADAGYEVATASDGVAALKLFEQGAFDLVLLDVMLPKLDGYSVCRAIRERGATPVVMLTALDEEEAQVKAFELQVDDYITKPFSLKLVLLRIEAVLRRATEGASTPTTMLRYQGVQLDTDAREVRVDGRRVALTRIEYELLRLFMEHPGRVFTRENLLSRVWGYEYVGDAKVVNLHIMNLRRKLGPLPLETVRGVGYRLAKREA